MWYIPNVKHKYDDLDKWCLLWDALCERRYFHAWRKHCFDSHSTLYQPVAYVAQGNAHHWGEDNDKEAVTDELNILPILYMLNIIGSSTFFQCSSLYMVSKEQPFLKLFKLDSSNRSYFLGFIWTFFYAVLVLDLIQRNVLSTHKRPLNMWCAIILENR